MRCGRSKRTVSTVVVVTGPVLVICAASAMSLPRSQMSSLSCIALGVRPRYGPAITSKTVSGGAAIVRSIGPRGRTRRPMPRSSVSAPRTSNA